MSVTVLCVDPDDGIREEVRGALRSRGEFRVASHATMAAAIDDLDASVAAVVTAYDLPDGSGIDLVKRVRRVAPDAACVLFTDADPDEIDPDEEAIVEYVRKDDRGAYRRLADLVEHATAHRTQTAYPLPDDEESRLQAVRRYLEMDGGLDAALDRLTTLATALFDVSMASVGIVDEREQRFLACRGVDLSTFDREDTVCTYAMLEEDVTVVADLRADPRFEDNDGLRDLGMRSYASANLTTPDGHVIGTFCLYDGEVREYDRTDRKHLRLLADEAMDQLELRRRLLGREGPGTGRDDRGDRE